jgi:hypothetical protein
MSLYDSYASCGSQLYSKFGKSPWYVGLYGYLSLRYFHIERRIIEASRYVEISSENKATFSSEFASIIRDIGSTFGSLGDGLVRNTLASQKREYDIKDYLKFIVSEVKDAELIGARLITPFLHHFVFPFENIMNKTPAWWTAYNNLKHSDIDNFKDGCLGNVICGIASLATLFVLMDSQGVFHHRSELLFDIGYYQPIAKVKTCSF